MACLHARLVLFRIVMWQPARCGCAGRRLCEVQTQFPHSHRCKTLAPSCARWHNLPQPATEALTCRALFRTFCIPAGGVGAGVVVLIIVAVVVVLSGVG